jgi:hypothetical protein
MVEGNFLISHERYGLAVTKQAQFREFPLGLPLADYIGGAHVDAPDEPSK